MESEKLDILVEVLGRYYRSGSEYLFGCPKCDHDKRKLSVNLDKGVFKCWICGYSGLKLASLVKRYGPYSEYTRWTDIDGSVDIASFDDLFATKEEEVHEIRVSLPDSFKTLTGHSKGFPARHAGNYLKSRNITRDDILRWKIGFCDDGDYEGRICIPSFDGNGNLNYFIARGYGRQYPKYKNPPASRDIIFNDLYVDWDEPIVLVEGVFDAIVAGNAVPILGSVLKETSKLFQKIIREKSTVYIALDPDAKYKEQKIINSLLEYDIKVYKINVEPFDDVGSMSKHDFLQRKKDATIIDSTHYLYQCLEF
jgi:DNA primase